MRIVFSRHEYNGFLVKGTPGYEIMDEIDVHESDLIIGKKRPDIFLDAGLDYDGCRIDIADGVCDIVNFQRFIRNNLKITADNIEQAEKIAAFVNGELLTEFDGFWVTEKGNGL